MRDWRNRQTRTFKGRVGDRVSSSLTSRTKSEPTLLCWLFLFAKLRTQMYRHIALLHDVLFVERKFF